MLFKRGLVVLAGLGLSGSIGINMACAKFPSTGGDGGGKIIIFRMKVDGKIRSGEEPGSGGLPYVYMVAIRPSTSSNPIEQGPIPVIAPPWGNGFVAGNCTHFIWWNPQQFPRYAIYKFQDTLLNTYTQVGIPVTYTDVPQGGQEIRFEINLSQIEPDPVAAAALESFQVNFLTMDRIAQAGTTKFWDAIGDGRVPSQINDYLIIPLRTSAVFQNSDNLVEPRNDVQDPDLDIVDWSVEVRIL